MTCCDKREKPRGPTFRPAGTSIPQEPRMGTTGLALPWKARISSAPRERGTRVEPSEHFGGGANPAAADATSEDAALAAACRSGDLRAYERLYAMHGAKMKNLARNVLGNSNDARFFI